MIKAFTTNCLKNLYFFPIVVLLRRHTHSTHILTYEYRARVFDFQVAKYIIICFFYFVLTNGNKNNTTDPRMNFTINTLKYKKLTLHKMLIKKNSPHHHKHTALHCLPYNNTSPLLHQHVDPTQAQCYWTTFSSTGTEGPGNCSWDLV